MRVLQVGPYPPPHGGVETNLVAVRKGTVEVTRLDKKEPRPVTAGTVIALSEKAEERSLSADESTEIQHIAEIPPVQGIENKTDREIESQIRPLIEKQADPGHAMIPR